MFHICGQPFHGLWRIVYFADVTTERLNVAVEYRRG
jgi:hypothetical protein